MDSYSGVSIATPLNSSAMLCRNAGVPASTTNSTVVRKSLVNAGVPAYNCDTQGRKCLGNAGVPANNGVTRSRKGLGNAGVPANSCDTLRRKWLGNAGVPAKTTGGQLRAFPPSDSSEDDVIVQVGRKARQAPQEWTTKQEDFQCRGRSR